MITQTALNRVGKATTPRACIAARVEIAQYRINEAYFTHTMTLSECAKFRLELMGVSVLGDMHQYERAADILGRIEYALDAAVPLQDNHFDNDYADTVCRFGSLTTV